jgi:hypothetical protein
MNCTRLGRQPELKRESNASPHQKISKPVQKRPESARGHGIPVAPPTEPPQANLAEAGVPVQSQSAGIFNSTAKTGNHPFRKKSTYSADAKELQHLRGENDELKQLPGERSSKT